MKRLLVTLVAVVAVSSAFVRVADTRTFESESDVSAFVVYGEAGEDASALADYDQNQPAFTAPYPCDGYGDKYFMLDTGSATLWRTNTTAGDVYFDMVMQFNPRKTAPVPDDDAKIAVYMNASSNLVVVAGDGTPARNSTPYEIDSYSSTILPGAWGRLTIASETTENGLLFKVYLNGEQLFSGKTGEFQSLVADTTITWLGLSGTGALDDFVVRTTDPFIKTPAATIGEEGYASFAQALADANAVVPPATITLEADASMPAPLAYGESVSVKLNNHALTGITSGLLVSIASESGDVTTYTATYFPRTATAGQDGTDAHPYEIASKEDFLAFQAAVAADPVFRNKS